VSIVKAAKVDGLYMSGRYAEAVAASESAKKWAIASAVTSLVVIVLYIGLMIILAVVGAGSYETSY
jgi:hypothetical protein